MIYNISYRDRSTIRKINETIGSPFGLIQRLKMKGIGSPRFILNTSSEDIDKRLPSDESSVKISIELRPNGIIVHFKKFMEHYSWIIPYYKLSIYYSDNLSIYSDSSFIKISKDNLRKPHIKFIKKLINLKAEFSKNYIT